MIKYPLIIFLWFLFIGIREPIPITYFSTNPVVTVKALSLKSFDEITHLTKLINSEALYEPDEGQKEVLGVVLARVASKKFPNTIKEVIYQKGQFDGIRSKYFKVDKKLFNKVRQWYLEKYTSKYIFFYNPCTSTDSKFIKWVSRNYPNTYFIQNHIFHGKNNS